MRVLATLAASALLLSPPAMAQAPKPAWIADAQSGCRVWNVGPEPNETVTWSGACKQNLAQGQGVEQWFLDAHPTDRFEGDYRNGKRSGKGVFTWSNGNRYDGAWRRDNMNGKGIYTWADGSRYDGNWHDGKANGQGQLTNAGGTLKGIWTNGCFKHATRRAAVGVDLSACP